MLRVMRGKARKLRARSYANDSLMAKMDTQGVRELLGVLLADGCLTRRRGPSHSRVIAAMHGSPREQDFLEEKAAEVRRWVPTQARVTPYRTARRESGQRTTVLRFRFTSEILTPIYNLLYPNGEREITHPALQVLGGRAAAWLWAEGARPLEEPGSFLLRRVGRWEGEARLISGWIAMLTGADSEVVHPRALQGKGKGLPQLWFKADQATRLQDTLAPYAPVSRLSLFRRD